MMVGGTLPLLWGDYNSFGLANAMTTMLGGFAGIWLAAWASKHIDI